MIRRFTQHWARLGRRRVSALLLMVSLNLAILPCAMALEVAESAHDCCPPEIQLEAAECCTLDDVSIDTRSGSLKPYDSPELAALPASAATRDRLPAFAEYVPIVEPPGPPGKPPPLHKLFCVYLR